ncbi:MAG: caspase family protein [Blastocatellia bacterium]
MRRLILVIGALSSLTLSPFLTVSPFLLAGGRIGRAAPSQRAPFVLELPDLGGLRITVPESSIPTAELQTLRFLVLQPFADSIEYSAIYTAINGESAGPIQEVRAGPNGKIVLCRLANRPRFHLHPGKNVVEIRAVDHSRTTYYASFVLEAGGPGRIDNGLAGVERVTVASGPDRMPPDICISEPRGTIRLAHGRNSVRVAGLVADDSGRVASLAVNGAPARLEPAPKRTAQMGTGHGGPAHTEAARTGSGAGRRMLTAESSGAQTDCAASQGSMAFEATAAVGEGAKSLLIEARDPSGNLTRVSMPVIRAEPLTSPRFDGQKYAVVIGISHYEYHERGLNDLAYADADSRAIRDWLLAPNGGGFSPENVLYLENEQATLDAVRAALNGFLPKAGPSDMIFFFFAGHGAPDPDAPQNLYFLMHDTRVSRMAETALPMSELGYELKARMRTKQVVAFIDACHSAGIAGGGLEASHGTENNLVNLYAKTLFGGQGGAILTASDVSEPSRENPGWGHGIFTLALLEGLEGAADFNGDRVVTCGELFQYVRSRVAIATSFKQNPQESSGDNPLLAVASVTRSPGPGRSSGH